MSVLQIIAISLFVYLGSIGSIEVIPLDGIPWDGRWLHPLWWA